MKSRAKISFLLFFIIIQLIGKSSAHTSKNDFDNQIYKEVTNFTKDAIEMIKTLQNNYQSNEEAVQNIYDLKHKFSEWNEKLIQVNQSMTLEDTSTTQTVNFLLVFSKVYEEINYYNEEIGLDENENDEEVLHIFNNLVKYVSDSKKWYNFLTSLNSVLSTYQIQTKLFFNDKNFLELKESCDVNKDLVLLSESNLGKLIERIENLNHVVSHHENVTNKQEILYDNVKNINIAGVKLKHLCNSLKLAFNSSITKCHGNKMQIRGENVKLSKILYDTCNNTQIVEIFALNTIFIDTDFAQPNKQLILIAPFFVVKPLTMKFKNKTLDLVKKYNYSETPEKSGGIFFGFEKDVNVTNSGYITLHIYWEKENEMLTATINYPGIRKIYSFHDKSFFNLANNQSDDYGFTSWKTVTIGHNHEEFLVAVNGYKKFLIESLKKDKDHRREILINFHDMLEGITHDRYNFDIPSTIEELEYLDELYLHKHQEIDFGPFYYNLYEDIRDKVFLRKKCNEECRKVMFYLKATASSKHIAITYSSNFGVKTLKEHMSDFTSNINWTNDFTVIDRLRTINIERAKHIEQEIQETELLFKHCIKLESNEVIEKLHSDTKKLQTEISKIGKHKLSKDESILSLWENLLNEKLAFAIHSIILLSENFEIEPILKNNNYSNNALAQGNAFHYRLEFSNAKEEVLKIVETIVSNITKQEEAVMNKIFSKMKNTRLLTYVKHLDWVINFQGNVFELLENDLANWTMNDKSSNPFELLENDLLSYINSHNFSSSLENYDELSIAYQILEDLRHAELSSDFYLKGGIEGIKYTASHSAKLEVLHRYARKINMILKNVLTNIKDELSFVKRDSKFDIHIFLRDELLRLKPFLKRFNKSKNLQLLVEKVSEVIDSYNDIRHQSNDFWSLEFLMEDLNKKRLEPKENFNRTIYEIIEKSENMTEKNVWLFYYNNFLQSYKQHVFPFGFASSVQDIPKIHSIDLTEVKLHLQKHIETFHTTLPPDYNNFEKYIRHKFFHRSEIEASQPFFVWDNETYGSSIEKLLDGEIITLKSSLQNGLKLNAIKFKTIDVKLQSLDMNQEHLQEILSKFKVSLKHLGKSYYNCDRRCYIIRSDTVEYNLNFGRTVTNFTSTEQAPGDYFLSPYSLWELQLKHVNSENQIFTGLSQFKYKVDIDLQGHGSYLDYSGPDVCKNDLKEYYEEVPCD